MNSDYKIDMYSELAFQSSETLMFGYPSMNMNEPFKKKKVNTHTVLNLL